MLQRTWLGVNASANKSEVASWLSPTPSNPGASDGSLPPSQIRRRTRL